MKLFSHLMKTNALSRTLVLHIGSSSVAAAIVEGDRSEAKVVASASTNMTVLPEVGIVRFEQEMETALKTTLASIAKSHLPVPHHVRVFLASPWYAAQVRHARMTLANPATITKSMVEEMVSREIQAFTEEEIAKSHEAGEPLKPLESLVVDMRVNGYQTHRAEGMKGKELELSLFLSVMPERIRRNIEEIVHKQYHRPVQFGTFLAASFVVTRDHFPHEDSYLLIDVGGEVTDVTLVREGAIYSTVSFPLGRNFILRELSAGLKRSVPEALSICTLYTENKVEETLRNQCETVLKGAKDEWLAAFQNALFTTSNHLSVPNTIMLSSLEDIAPWFMETISREEFHQHSLTNKEFKVVLLDAKAFHESLSFMPGVPRNPCTIIEALAFLK